MGEKDISEKNISEVPAEVQAAVKKLMGDLQSGGFKIGSVKIFEIADLDIKIPCPCASCSAKRKAAPWN